MSLRFIKNKPFLFKLRLVWMLFLCLLVMTLLYFKVLPFGRVVYTRDFSDSLRSGKGFIYSFSPAERVDMESGFLPRLVGDPIYFSLFTPRTFSHAKITIKYRDALSSSTPIFSAGVLVDNLVWRYDLKPLANRLLDEWPDSQVLSFGRLKLYQNQVSYSSIVDFLKDVDEGNVQGCNAGGDCLALYNYSLARNYKIADYKSPGLLAINQPLRGHYQAFVYLKDEKLSLSFEFVDLNFDPKGDPLDINLYKDGALIASRHLPDNRPGAGQESLEALQIDFGYLAEGVYKLELRASDDIVSKTIKASTGRWSFNAYLWPVSGSGGLRLFTDASLIQIKALTPASLQSVVFNNRKFKLDEAYKQFDFYSPGATAAKEMRFAKDDVIIESSGVFSFSADDLFNPSWAQVNGRTNREDFAYVLADYESPLMSEGYKIVSAEFNLIGAYRENGKYSFMLSVPGLKTEDGRTDYLEIESIQVELDGRTLWEKIGELILEL